MSEKRFTLSKEDFAVERVDAVRESIEELKRKHPEVISLGLFGSLPKGKSTPESDIDGYLFVDAANVEVMHHEDESADAVVEYAEFEDEIPGLDTRRVSLYPHFRPDIDDFYQDLIRKTVREKLPTLTAEQAEHLRPLPISRDVIDYLVDHQEEAIINIRKFEDRVEAEYKKSDKSKDKKEFLKDIHPQPETYVTPSILFRSMLHLDVGGGLKKYRQYLVDLLSTHGKLGEDVWAYIIRDLESWEQKSPLNELPTEKHYPRSLADAVKLYGSHEKQNEQ